MEWLRKVLRPSPSVASRVERDERLVHVDWNLLEKSLAQLSGQAIARFASNHAAERFSALAFDCHAELGQVLICLSPKSPAESHRWELGDWEYHGINLDDEDWASGWGEFELQVQSRVGFLLDEKRGKELPLLTENFMVAASRALIAVQSSDEARALRRVPEFSVLCIDHDESVESALARMSRVKASGA